jgi:hypothetical protein
MAVVMEKPPKIPPVDHHRPYSAQIEQWRPLYRSTCPCVHLRCQARLAIGALTQIIRRTTSPPVRRTRRPARSLRRPGQSLARR